MTKEEAQQHLQDTLVKTYFSNLEFFKEVDKNLYERILVLSEAINNGSYKERYSLEFFEKDGDFDIFDNSANEYLYNKKPKKYNNHAVASINFDKKGFFSTLEPSFYEQEKITKNIDKDNLQESYEAQNLLLKNVQEYLDVLKDDTKSQKKHYKSIDKFVFVGTLLGRHMPSLIEKFKSKVYFVHEPNLEIFRLSLFVFDYTLLLSNNSIFFISVMESSDNLIGKINTFLNVNPWDNHTIKFFTTDYNVKKSFDDIMNGIIFYKPTNFNYNMLLYNVFRNLSTRINKYKLLTFPYSHDINLFNDKPVLFICAGPSLKENIEFVKQHKNYFFIVAIGASFKKLLENQIKPNMIITIDSKFEDLNKLQFDEESCKQIQDCIILASINTDQRILDRFNQDRLFLFDVLTTLKENTEPISGYSVGEVGYKVLLSLGVKNLYLLGTDLAIDQKSGSSHGTSFSGNKRDFDLDNVLSSMEKESFDLNEDLIKVEGNFQKEVYTTRNLNNSLTIYNKFSKEIKKSEQKVFNLCKNGAYIYGTIPLEIDKVFLDKEINLQIDEYVKIFNNITSKGLTKTEKSKLNLELQVVIEIISMVKNYSQFTYKEYKDFRKTFIKMNDEIAIYSKENKFFIFNIIAGYISIINPYLDYCFNDYKIKNEAKKVQKVSSLWFLTILSLLEDYKKYLLNVVD